MGFKTILNNGKTILNGGKMMLNLFATSVGSGVYFFDFGYNVYETSGNWNNIINYVGVSTNIIDHSGITSSISLTCDFGGITWFDDNLPVSSIYPISAIRDCFVVPGDNTQTGNIVISGLNQNKIYDIYLYCYSQTYQKITFDVLDKNDTSQYTLLTLDNITNKILSPDRVPTTESTITINLINSGYSDAGISVMELIEKEPVTYDSSSIQKVLITFNSIPTSTGITKAALKYDKRFALSYVCDDNMIDQYTYGFPYLNGGIAADDNYYSGKTYTDGCGNKIKFNLGLSIFSMNGVGVDVHTSVYTANIQWNQYPEMYNAGWAVTSHSLDHESTSNYNIERNRSYVYSQTSGCTIKIFTQPSSNTSFIDLIWAITGNTKYYEYMNGNNWQWFGNGSTNIPAGRVDNVDYTDGSNIISYAAWPVKNFSMYRTNCSSSAEIQTQIANLLKATGTTSHTWKSLLVHSLAGQGGGFSSFDDFKTAMDYIEDNHGSDGTDNCWMVNDQDVYEYLVARDTTIVSQVANQNTLELTFDWSNTNSGNTLPDDMRKYCLSLLVSGNTSISDIIIYGGTGSTYNKNYKTNTALINLNWNGGVSETTRLLRVATERVEIAEATTTSNDKAIAQDYVTSMSAGTDKTSLQNRLNAI